MPVNITQRNMTLREVADHCRRRIDGLDPADGDSAKGRIDAYTDILEHIDHLREGHWA